MRETLVCAAAAGALVLGGALAACRGPTGGPVDAVTAYTPETHTPFPIAAGNHAGIDCNVCHGAFDSFKGFDCLSCHRQADTDPWHTGVLGYQWSSQQCYRCHPDGTSSVDHSLFFPIAAGQTHAGIGCATCHVDPANRRNFDCLSCHTQPNTDPWHTGVTGYAWSSPQCYSCHPRSDIPAFPHPAFPVGPGATHANLSCSRCHADPANLTTIDCVTCHPSTTNSPKHSSVGGFTSTTAACLRCHGDSQVNPVVAHLPFLIVNPLTSPNRHYRESCVRCHPSYRTDKPFAADFGLYDCLTCHAGIHNNQYPQSTSCTRSGCHPSGRRP